MNQPAEDLERLGRLAVLAAAVQEAQELLQEEPQLSVAARTEADRRRKLFYKLSSANG